MNSPNPIDNDSSSNTIIVKISGKDGITLWAKTLKSIFDGTLLSNYQTSMLNDVAWCLLTPYAPPKPVPSVIIKVDASGEVISSFYIMNGNYQDASNGYILQVFSFALFPDESTSNKDKLEKIY